MRWIFLVSMILGGAACEPEPIPSCAGAEEVHWEDGRLRFSVADCADLDLVARVLGTGEWTVRMEEQPDGSFQPIIETVSAGRFEGLVLEGTWSTEGAQAPVLWRQGYQSWSYSGVIALEDLTLDSEGVPLIAGDGDATTVFDETVGTSWGLGLVGRDDGSSLLLGARGLTKTRFFVAFDDSRVWVVWGHRGEQVELDVGDELPLDPLWIDAGTDPWLLHVDYADGVAAVAPPRLSGGTPPTGWATWYQYFEDITEAEVRANLARAQDLREEASNSALEVFQIDDGWQQFWGDWEADDGFPSGMATLASDIEEAGFVPGLWMAPLYVDRSTETYQEHPDWWVRSADGSEITFTNLDTGDYAILDVSHPDARTWLANLIADKVAEGWSYLKLDFLYAAAEEGLRSQPMTGTEAYHLAMKTIREAAGDAWILACGAPFLPSVGYAESYRTGSDIAFGFDRRPQLAYMRWQARATAARGWGNGRWWWNDPDQLLVRDPLTEVEVTGSVVANLVSGGTWMLGDDLTALTDERLSLALHPLLTDLRGQEWVPQSPLQYISGLDAGPVIELIAGDDQVPVRWVAEDGTTALLNLGSLPVVEDSPAGTEQISGLSGPEQSRTLLSGQGEVWRP
jgi:hypothetical protein